MLPEFAAALNVDVRLKTKLEQLKLVGVERKKNMNCKL